MAGGAGCLIWSLARFASFVAACCIEAPRSPSPRRSRLWVAKPGAVTFENLSCDDAEAEAIFHGSPSESRPRVGLGKGAALKHQSSAKSCS